MSLYVTQFLLNLNFKAGWAEGSRMHDRLGEHGTAAGPQRLIATSDTLDRTDEARLFEDLRDSRVGSGRSLKRKKPYEILRCTPQALRYLSSKAFRALGFTLHNTPIDPKREEAVAYLERLAEVTHGSIREAVEHNIRTETALAPYRAPHAGGYTLADALAGVSWGRERTSVGGKQTCFGFAVDVIEEHGLLFSVVRCSGLVFRFVVIAEVQERERLEVHPKAIQTGVQWLKPKRKSGRAPPHPTKRHIETPNEAQVTLFGQHRSRGEAAE